MPLRPVILDDLDWKGMVEAVRRRIPAASPDWTLHAPVDPGITLLELFAWQLEQRLYRLDQVDEPFTRGLLGLLGERPRRTRCAHTVLQVVADSAASVPRRTTFSLTGAQPPVVVSTRSALRLLRIAPDGLRLWVGTRDRSADLRHGRVFRLLPAPGEGEGTRIELSLQQAPHEGMGNEWIGLFVQLRVDGAIPPQWSHEAIGGVPPPGKLAWCYRGADARRHAFTVDDGTGGLRRSGIVRLRIPHDWTREPDGAFAIHLVGTSEGFSSPPRLCALVPNAVIARHARPTTARALQLHWLPLPGNTIPLGEVEIAFGDRGVPPLAWSCALALKEADGHWHRWWPRASLHAAGPHERVFVVDAVRAQLRFGDGVNGRLPVLADPAQPNACVRYLVGGGSAGLVGPSPRAIEPDWSGTAPASGHAPLRARNLTASTGGAEAETLDEARGRTAYALSLPTRAVTAADYVAIARSTPGVAVRRAHAAIGRHPAQPCIAVPGAVTVYVVPDAPREDGDPELVEPVSVPAPVPDAGLLAAVRAQLDAARLLATQVFVSAPRYRPVRLRATVVGDVHAPAQVLGAMREHLQRFLDPLVGGADGTGWPFGEPLRPSVMLRELQAAAGQQARVTDVALGLDGEPASESCRAVAIGAHELVWLQDLQIEFARSTAAVGGLR